MYKLISFLILLSVWCPSLFAATWHVDAQTGDNADNGQSPETAFQTIQSAVNSAGPGDQILVGVGVYHENIVMTNGGTADAPVKIVAANPHCYQTVLSGAVPAIRQGAVNWELANESLQLYRIPLNYRPVRVLADGVDVSAYESLNDLKAFQVIADDYPGNQTGFAWEEKTQSLYVRLRADGKYGVVDPNDAIMAVAPPTGGGRWGSLPNRPDNFLIALNFSGSAHVIIDGFTFETPGLAGVFSSADDLAVRNCWFYGCRYGVAGTEDGNTARVEVANCFYTQYPAYSDAEDILRTKTATPRAKHVMHWQRKAGWLPSGGLKAPYSYETGLIRRIGKEWIVRSNFIWESFEAFASGAVSNSKDSVIESNHVERICDNAFETEEHAQGLTIRGNLVIDVFEPFSWQPQNGAPLPGPIYIYDNIIWQTPEDIALWTRARGSQGGVFKIGINHNRMWDNGSMGDTPRNRTPAPSGFWVAHNTILDSYKRMFTSLNPNGRHYENFFFFNNIIVANSFAQSRLPNGPEGVVYFGNAISFEKTPPEAARVAAGMGGWIDGDGFMLSDLALAPGRFSVPPASRLATSGWTNKKAFQSICANVTIPDDIPLRKTVGSGKSFIHAGPEAMNADFIKNHPMSLKAALTHLNP